MRWVLALVLFGCAPTRTELEITVPADLAREVVGIESKGSGEVKIRYFTTADKALSVQTDDWILETNSDSSAAVKVRLGEQENLRKVLESLLPLLGSIR